MRNPIPVADRADLLAEVLEDFTVKKVDSDKFGFGSGAGEMAPSSYNADTGLFKVTSQGGSHQKAVQSSTGILNSYIKQWNGTYTAGQLAPEHLQVIADALVDIQAAVGEGFLSRLRGFALLENDNQDVAARSIKQHGVVMFKLQRLTEAAAGVESDLKLIRDELLHEVAHQWDMPLNSAASVVANHQGWLPGGVFHGELLTMNLLGKDGKLLGYPLDQALGSVHNQ